MFSCNRKPARADMQQLAHRHRFPFMFALSQTHGQLMMIHDGGNELYLQRNNESVIGSDVTHAEAVVTVKSDGKFQNAHNFGIGFY